MFGMKSKPSKSDKPSTPNGKEKIRKEEYSFKFINREIPVNYESDISFEFNELRECLASENVNLSHDDILKAFDIWLRVIGLGRSTNDSVELENILSMCGPVMTHNPFDKEDDPEPVKDLYLKSFIGVNEVAQEDKLNNPIEDINTIADHIDVVFKEFSIFWNDLTKYMYKVFMKDRPDEYAVIAEAEHSKANFVKMAMMNDTKYGPSIVIFSTVLGHKFPSRISVVVGTYPNIDFSSDKVVK